MGFQEIISQILKWLGENVPKVSALAITKISEITGQEQSQFVGKLVTILLFAFAIFFSSKITNKLAKIVIVLLSILLIISVFYSFI